MWNRWTLLAVIVITVPILVVYASSLLAKRPAHLGVRAGMLHPCPKSPNCVSTQADDEEHRIEGIRFSGDAADALVKLKNALSAVPRATIITETEDYMHVECVSLVFRFTDDVEFWIDAANHLIHFRSASRVGHSDFGVNRERMETIRQAFEARP